MPDTEANVPANQTRISEPFLRRLFRNQWFSAIITGILFVWIGLYLTGGKQYRKLIVGIHPARASIVKSGQASKLSVKYENTEIKDDISIAMVYFWNEGSQSIRSENILSPIILRLDGQILEATVRFKRRNVSTIDLSQDELRQGKLVVNWSILEQGDGAILPLIYAGPPSRKIYAGGIIEGQGDVRMSDLHANPGYRLALSIQRGVLIILIALVICFIVFFIREKKKGKKFEPSFLVLAVFFFILIIVGAKETWKGYQKLVPPFELERNETKEDYWEAFKKGLLG